MPVLAASDQPDSRVAAAAAGPVVHVWSANLDGEGDHPLWALSERERRRAAQILDPARRRRWSRARAILRDVLAAHLDRDPAELALTAGPRGKPELAGQPGRLRFSVSHSRGIALYALADREEVGIDVEHTGRKEHVLRAVERRALRTGRRSRLGRLPADERELNLLRAWVRREAELKCLGLGLLGLGDGEPRLWVRELEVGDGAVAALACARPLHARLRSWPERNP